MSDPSRLDEAIRSGLSLPDDVELATIAYGTTPEWDSVAHMQLVVALEMEFGIMLETDDVIAMSDYAQIHRILEERYGVLARA